MKLFAIASILTLSLSLLSIPAQAGVRASFECQTADSSRPLQVFRFQGPADVDLANPPNLSPILLSVNDSKPKEFKVSILWTHAGSIVRYYNSNPFFINDFHITYETDYENGPRFTGVLLTDADHADLQIKLGCHFE